MGKVLNCTLVHGNVYPAHLVGREKFSSVSSAKGFKSVFLVLCAAAQCLQRCIVSHHVNNSLGILQI